MNCCISNFNDTYLSNAVQAIKGEKKPASDSASEYWHRALKEECPTTIRE